MSLDGSVDHCGGDGAGGNDGGSACKQLPSTLANRQHRLGASALVSDLSHLLITQSANWQDAFTFTLVELFSTCTN